jgi:hypothetical protein
MANASTPDAAVAGLTVRERVLLFCAASGTDWKRAGVIDETATAMIVKGLIVRNAIGRLKLTDRGRTALLALLPDLLDYA